MIESERVGASCLAPTRQVSTLVVCVLCDWIAFTGESVLICAHFVSFCLIRILMRHFVSSERFFSPCRLPRPFSLLDRRGTSWWTSRMAALFIRGGSSWYRHHELWWCAGLCRSADRRADWFLRRVAAFYCGHCFVTVFDSTDTPSSCLRWSCFEFSPLSGERSGLRFASTSAP